MPSNTWIMKRFDWVSKKRLVWAFCSVFLLGLAAHAFGFLNLNLTHDSLNEFYLFGDTGYYPNTIALHKIGMGRFVAPLYNIVFHGVTVVPWLIGLLSLLWISLSVWLICEMFEIDGKALIVLISGFMCINVPFIVTAATYIHDLDSYMFAVLLSTLAAFLWKRGGKVALFSIPCFFFVMGIYQSMISVGLCLIIFDCIVRSASGERFSKVFLSGLKACGFALAAGILYLVTVKLAYPAFGAELNDSSEGLAALFATQGRSPLGVLYHTLRIDAVGFLYGSSGWPASINIALHSVLLLAMLYAVIRILVRKSIPVANKILIVALLVITPFVLNLAYLLNGASYYNKLMLYPLCLVYLLTLLLLRCGFDEGNLEGTKLQRGCTVVSALVIALVIFANIQTANEAYVKRNLDCDAQLSMMTCITQEIRDNEGYVQGESKVLFVGIPQYESSSAFDNLNKIGLGYIGIYYPAYYEYVLRVPINIVDSYTQEARTLKNDEAVKDMPCFPEEGSIQWVGETLIVKMSD